MNLSCSGGGLPESGCLFFKVAGNTSTVASKKPAPLLVVDYLMNLYFTAKFNCTVPGILHDCSITTMDKIPETSSIVTAMVTTTVTTSNHMPTNIHTTHTSLGIPLLASLIGDAVIAVILAVSITIMCVVIRVKIGRNDQPNTPSSTVTASTNTSPQEKSLGTSSVVSVHAGMNGQNSCIRSQRDLCSHDS